MSDQQYYHSGLKYVILKAIASLVRAGARRAAGKETIKALENIPSDVSRKRIEVQSRQSGRTIIVDVYDSTERPDKGPRPVLFNFHGSGFVIDSMGQDALWCSLVAQKTDFVVLDVDYRKAPEYPFPAAVEDVEDVIRYAQQHSDAFDASRMATSGFSAGGNLAMTAAVNQDAGTIKAVAAFYANSDMTQAFDAPSSEFDSGIDLPQWLRSFFYSCYIPPHLSRDDPRLSPIFAKADRWPKNVFLACGQGDNLCEPNRILAEKLRGYGNVDVEWMPIEREAHSFDKSPKTSESEERRQKMYDAAIVALNKIVS